MTKCSICNRDFNENTFLKTSMQDAFPNQPMYFVKVNWSNKNGNPANLIFKPDEDITFCGAECSNKYYREKNETF